MMIFFEPAMKLTLTFITIQASKHFVSLLLNSQQLQTVTKQRQDHGSLYFTFDKERKRERTKG